MVVLKKIEKYFNFISNCIIVYQYKVSKMSVKILSLMLPCVESQYTQEYIANVFWRQGIAKVSRITLIPYLKDDWIRNIAYINVDGWCETEAAYNFIKRLNDSSKEARIVHHVDEWWAVEFNTHNNGDILVGAYTMTFDDKYFKRELEDDNYPTAPCSEDEEEQDESKPIKVYGKYYTVEEARDRLRDLEYQIDDMEDAWPVESLFEEVMKEIHVLEDELSIHDAVNSSSNVTLRKHQRSKARRRQSCVV